MPFIVLIRASSRTRAIVHARHSLEAPIAIGEGSHWGLLIRKKPNKRYLHIVSSKARIRPARSGFADAITPTLSNVWAEHTPVFPANRSARADLRQKRRRVGLGSPRLVRGLYLVKQSRRFESQARFGESRHRGYSVKPGRQITAR
jgi:hypothetical protein